MPINIQDFILIHQQQNGVFKLKWDNSKESNIHKWLFNQGFRQGKVGGKRVQYRKVKEQIKIVNITDFKDAFYHFLEHENYEGCPEGVIVSDILNWFLQYKPIRQNGLLEYNLKETLFDFEEHEILMQIDGKYRKKHTKTFSKTGEMTSLTTEEEDVVIRKAKSFHSRYRKKDSNRSKQNDSTTIIHREWQNSIEDKDAGILVEVPVGGNSGKRIDVINTRNSTAYEMKVSGNNPNHEFYKDIFKVINYNLYQASANKIRTFVFLTESVGIRKLIYSIDENLLLDIQEKHGLFIKLVAVN